jgi:hypothetical protein
MLTSAYIRFSRRFSLAIAFISLMRQKPGTRKSHGEKAVKDIRRPKEQAIHSSEGCHSALRGLQIKCLLQSTTHEAGPADSNIRGIIPDLLARIDPP